jgi:EAL domain-containing protein (putative c-di-GMP-specific phosphodiesterase class I)
MARALGMTLIAEGVETERQVRTLRLLGWRFAQGFYFGRPQPADVLAERLRRRPVATTEPSAAAASA